MTINLQALFFNQLNEGPYWATSVAVGGRHAGAAGGVMNIEYPTLELVDSLSICVLQIRSW